MDEFREMEVERLAPEAAGGILTLAVAGDVDLAVAERFAEQLSPQPAQDGKPVIVDLSEVGFIDSSGLRVLLTMHRTLADAGIAWAVVLEPGSSVERTLELTALTETLPTYPSRAEALEALTS